MLLVSCLSDCILREPFLGEEITVGDMERVSVNSNICANYQVAGTEFLIAISNIFVLFSL